MDDIMKNMLSEWNGQTENRKAEAYNEEIHKVTTNDEENSKFRKQIKKINSELLWICQILKDAGIISDYSFDTSEFDNHNKKIEKAISDAKNVLGGDNQ